MNNEEKLSTFQRLVLNEAYAERDAAIKKLKDKQKEALEVAEQEEKARIARRLSRETDKIVGGINAEIVESSVAYKKQLLAKREALIGNLFDGLATRLEEFIKTEDYREYLLCGIKQAAETLGGKSLELKLCSRDEGLGINPEGMTVKYINNDAIGGFILTDIEKGLLIDETIALKLKTERENILDLCHMRIA